MSFETQPRRAAKEAVYGAPKCSTKHSNPIVERLAAGLNIEWLASRSGSFWLFTSRLLAIWPRSPQSIDEVVGHYRIVNYY